MHGSMSLRQPDHGRSESESPARRLAWVAYLAAGGLLTLAYVAVPPPTRRSSG
jgi:hypothetical protein